LYFHQFLTKRVWVPILNVDLIYHKVCNIVWWFEDLAKYLNDNYAEGIDILKVPSRVYNADESGFPQDLKSGKILAPRGSKNVIVV
jgi:hypothetical protein